MSKSYRIRTKLGADQNINVTVEQDFDFLEILSLKLRQEDVYSRFCADYGVVVGRVVANSGFGLPNATVSIFVPIDDMDLQDPVISTLYPYKSVTDKNEDGYRYNLLPYEKQYGGHTPTGTFPSRSDVMTRNEVLEIYEKYYRYTVKTNESGDFMITGVPLGNQKIVMDLDLSNMGCFSLRPQDLIRMNMGVAEQFDGSNFKSSNNIDELPQIVNQVKDIDVASFWGQEDLCNIGITRTDFDLREMGIEIRPTSVFMGSIFSDNDNRPLKPNCKPRTEQGDLCGLVTGPGEIMAIRQTIDLDENGDPVLEQHQLPNGGKVIDDQGTFVTDVPMNLDYVVTNEFGESVLSNDPDVGIPTKGKYRFKVKYQSEENTSPFDGQRFIPIKGNVIRPNFVVPQIREYGWDGSVSNPGTDPSTLSNSAGPFPVNFNNSNEVQSQFIGLTSNLSVKVFENTDAEKIEIYVNGQLRTEKLIDFPTGGTLEIRVTKKNNSGVFIPVTVNYELYDYKYSQFQKSYAFSLNWGEYADKDAAINCEDSFYLMNYNKVYTPSQMIDEYRKGYNRGRFLGIKEILNRDCESTNNKFPTNDGVKNFDLLYLVVSLFLLLFTIPLYALILVAHSFCLLWPVLRFIINALLTIIVPIMNLVITAINLFKKKNNKIEKVSLKDAYLAKECPLKSIPLPNLSYPACRACSCESVDPENEPEDDDLVGTVGTTLNVNYSKLVDTTSTDFYDLLSVTGGTVPNDWDSLYQLGYQMTMAGYDGVTTSQIYQKTPWSDVSWNVGNGNTFGSDELPLSEKFNLFNAKAKYHEQGGYNKIKVKVNKDIPFNSTKDHTDNVIMMVMDSTSYLNFTPGSVITFQNPDDSLDPNVSGTTTGTTTFDTSGNANVTIEYMNESTLTQNTTTYTITGGTQTLDYNFASDIEYYQIITGQTLSDYNALEGGNHVNQPYNSNIGNNTLAGRYLFGWQRVNGNYLVPNAPSTYPGTGYVQQTPNIQLNSDWEDTYVVFLVRGVDPNTPRQDVEYDLSRLYGKAMGTSGYKVRGQYKLNVPIQPYSNSSDYSIVKHNEITTNNSSDFSGLRLYYKSFTFTPTNSNYSGYTTQNHLDYSSYNGDTKENWYGGSPNVSLLGSVVDNVNDVARVSSVGSWSDFTPISPSVNNWAYRNTEIVEGVGAMYSDGTPSISGYRYYSPTYYDSNPTSSVNMSDNEFLVMRSDSLPTSDQHDFRFVLHQNRFFATYIISDEGEIDMSFSTQPGEVNFGSSEDFGEDAGAVASQVIGSFSCSGMVPLSCYSGNGESIGVYPSDDECYYVTDQKKSEKLRGGCYYLVTRIGRVGKDFGILTEWLARFRMMFALCNNVVSLTFVNNWINGSLYMFAVQKDDVYGNDVNETKFLSDPTYKYCKDTVVYQTINNSFFYRVSPYSNGNFIGRDNQPGLLPNNGSNNKYLGTPTTIMDLGPRDIFTKEICYNPEFQGYIVDTIKSTSYNDTSDILQLFVISRLSNSNFWSRVGNAIAPINQLFTRENNRLDGDVSQLISINSEYGVVPFLGSNYSDDNIKWVKDNDGEPIIGVLFEANTINRDMITPGRFTFQDTLTSHLTDNYGFNDQEVPFYQWGLKPNSYSLFGTELNDWVTKDTTGGLGSFNYQSMDRLTSTEDYVSDVFSPTTEQPGFIYNSKIVGTQIEVSNDAPSSARDKINTGSPYFFYFGLKTGKSAMNRYIDKYVLNQETL